MTCRIRTERTPRGPLRPDPGAQGRRPAGPDDTDVGRWHANPPAPATEVLTQLIVTAFARSGGDFDAGRHGPELLAAAGLDTTVRSEVLALEPGHPYLRLPVEFSRSLEPRLVLGRQELDRRTLRP